MGKTKNWVTGAAESYELYERVTGGADGKLEGHSHVKAVRSLLCECPSAPMTIGAGFRWRSLR